MGSIYLEGGVEYTGEKGNLVLSSSSQGGSESIPKDSVEGISVSMEQGELHRNRRNDG